MGIWARLHLAKIQTIAQPNSPDMPPKCTKKVRLGNRLGNRKRRSHLASSEEYQQAPAPQELFDDELHGAGLGKNVEAFHGQVYGVGENILIAKQRTWLL